VRKSVAVVVAIIVSTVLALYVGTAMANDNSANKRGRQGHGHHKAVNKTSGNAAANKGNAKGAANIAGATTLASNQTSSNKGNSENSAQDVSFAFKGTLAQDGAQDSPVQVKVEKANDAGKSFVGKEIKFTVSSDTEIYRDNADGQVPNLDAKLSDLKAGDNVMIQAKGAQEVTSFTAGLISAEPPTSNTADTPNTNNGSSRLVTNKNP
jgi:hypothetical protein